MDFTSKLLKFDFIPFCKLQVIFDILLLSLARKNKEYVWLLKEVELKIQKLKNNENITLLFYK